MCLLAAPALLGAAEPAGPVDYEMAPIVGAAGLEAVEVTVRFRGVMEKCSYCIQRIREVNQQANVEARNIRDGEVQTACQQACAAGAITFGDLADPNSAVSQAKRNPRRYELLAELGTKPRTSYLGRIRNLHPALAEPKPEVEPHPAGQRDDLADPAHS